MFVSFRQVLQGSTVKKTSARSDNDASTGVDAVDYDMRVNIFLAGIRVVALEHAFALMNYASVLQASMASDNSAAGGGDVAEETAAIATDDTAAESSAAGSGDDGSEDQQESEAADPPPPPPSSSIYVNVHVHKPTIFLLQDLSYDNPTALALSADVKVACSLVGAGNGAISGTRVKLLLQNVRCYRSSVTQRSPPQPHAVDFLQPLQGTLVRTWPLRNPFIHAASIVARVGCLHAFVNSIQPASQPVS